MKNLIKNIAIFAVGGAVGALTTSVLLKKKYEAIIEEELISIREMTAAREMRRGNTEDSVRRPKVSQEKEELSKLVRRYGGDVEAANAISEVRTRDIYVITTEEFSEGRTDHDKLTITFYEDDGVLADENEEIIEDPYSLIGDALERFGEGSEDAEIVYVRNERIAVDYEVVRLSKSYAETVGLN